jgi:hypothetical protein
LFDGPRDARALGDAILAFYDAWKAKPEKMTYRSPKVKTRAFRRAAFEACLDDPSVPSITLWADRNDTPTVSTFLRFIPDPAVPLAGEFESRQFGVAAPAPSMSLVPDSLWRLVRAAIVLSPVVQGCAGWFGNEYSAGAECWRGNAAEEDDETRARLKEDTLSWSSKRRRLRRLYPVTIIGPELWAQLPPLPEGTGATVEDIGDCKVLTAWPVLCGPRDPEFLRGTRALREWLWPYTIQNPADHLDNDPV